MKHHIVTHYLQTGYILWFGAPVGGAEQSRHMCVRQKWFMQLFTDVYSDDAIWDLCYKQW